MLFVVAATGIDEGLLRLEIDQPLHCPLVTHSKEVVKELRLSALHQLRYFYQRCHISEGIVCIVVCNAISFGNELQAVSRLTIRIHWPLNAIWPQRPRQPHDIKHIPAAPLILPAPLVRIIKVPPQQMADKLIVKAHIIEPHSDRPWCEDLLAHHPRTFCLAIALL